MPTLVVSGEFDERMVSAFADRLTTDIPGARHVRLNGSAHLPSLDAAERFAGVLSDVLAGLET